MAMKTGEVRIGTFTRSILLYVAESTGKFHRAGLVVTETPVPSSPMQFHFLGAGDLDFVMTSPDNTIAYRFLVNNPLGRKLDVVVLAAVDRGLGLSLCLAPKFCDALSVRGRAVGVDVPQSGFAFVAYALLERHGLAPGDYDVVALGSTPRRASALIAGTCSATVLNAGNELRAIDAGCKMIGTVRELGPYLGTVLAAIRVDEPRILEVRARFVDVILETCREIRAGKWAAEVIAASINLLGLGEQAAAMHHARLLDPQDGLVPDGIVDRESMSTVIGLRRKYLPAPPLDALSLDHLVDARALAAIASAGSD